MSQAVSQTTLFRSIRILMSSTTAIAGCVSLSWMATLSAKFVHEFPGDRKWRRMMSRRNPPLFERLGEQRVVRVAHRSDRDVPGRVPIRLLLVDQDPHELHDRDRRMRVIELDGHLVREIRPRISRTEERRVGKEGR